MRAVEVNPDLCDEAHGEKSPPPACLEGRDMRQVYDVTMPERVWMAFNWLTHGRSAREVMDLFSHTVQDALDRTLARLEESARRYYGAAGLKAPAKQKARLLTFDDLRDEAFAQGGEQARARYAGLIDDMSGEENPLLVSRTLVDHLATEAQIPGPAVVVGLGSLHYPSAHLDDRPEDKRFRQVLEEIAHSMATKHGSSIKIRGYFAGICDVSFFGQASNETQAEFIRRNTPSPAFIDHAPADALVFPTVNIGPWGREYHQKLERVHAAYAFEVLPDLLFEACRSMLAAR
jgi:arginine utilization protein RocB